MNNPQRTKAEIRAGESAPKMNRDDLIRLYAESVSRDLDEMSDATFRRRVELHDKLCDELKIKHDDFTPFAMTGGLTLTPAMCEKIIRMEIERNR